VIGVAATWDTFSMMAQPQQAYAIV
jgi:hypothetical protein